MLVPRDVLRKLLDDSARGVPFQLDEPGGPLRIVLFGAPATKPKRFRAKREKVDNDGSEG